MSFSIPVVLFIFRRTKTLDSIIGQIRQAAPSKIYIIADGGRNAEEQNDCMRCRAYAERLIDWDCEIIKNYAKSNRGVYENIGEGAKWVFEREEQAVFLEDDNFPEITFFSYCAELLEKYKKESRILWICGTNYLGTYESESDYMFTKHMLPCGWASWSDKFLQYYDGLLEHVEDQKHREQFRDSYFISGCRAPRLWKSQLYAAERTRYLLKTKPHMASWDHQMNFSVRSNGMYGISPRYNQIKNIGIDEFSIHGGNERRGGVLDLCEVPTYPLEFPLKSPGEIKVDADYEKRINRILNPSIGVSIGRFFVPWVKKIIGLNQYDSFLSYLKGKNPKKAKGKKSDK